MNNELEKIWEEAVKAGLIGGNILAVILRD
jgi:hypothetical protein